MTSALAAAYDRTGAVWQAGPGLIYDRLAAATLDRCPLDLAGARVLDLGAGTGAGGRAAQARGAEVFSVDSAFGMLAAGASHRLSAAVGDALALPFSLAAFDAVVAAFSLNHVDDPVAALREAVRVLRPGGTIVATAYASDDSHPVRGAVEAALVAAGWEPEPWFEQVRTVTAPRLATVERASKTATAAGLTAAHVEHLNVPFSDLSPEQLVAWRMGLAQYVAFIARLPPAERTALTCDALVRLGPDPPPLVRSIIVLTVVVPG
ncbi:MAG TPA: methyltransferase domain-containing protein [Acidimicrobiales bacterium]|nr:methyltransferase domain-containing protein [Acidimicrobiales bacterium]